MAQHKSAEKRIRRNARKAVVNKHRRSATRRLVQHTRQAVAAGDVSGAQALLGRTTAALQSAARRGVLHRNTSDRTISRLTRLCRQLDAPSGE